MKFKKITIGALTLGACGPLALMTLSCGSKEPDTVIHTNQFGGDYNFGERTLPENYKIPAGTTKIEDYAFSHVKNMSENFVIPDSVQEIGVGAFEGTKIPYGFK